MSNDVKPIKATLIYLICTFMQKTIGILTIPIFTRLMTSEDFGVFSVYLSWLTILTVFFSLNFGWDSIYNGFRDFEDKKEELINSVQQMSVLLALVYLGITFLYPSFFQNAFGLDIFYVRLIFMQLSISCSYDMWCAKKKFEFNYRAFGIATFLYTVIPVVISLVCVAVYKENSAYVRICSTSISMCIICFIMFIDNAILAKFKINIQHCLYAIKLNIPLVPHYLCRTLLNHLDHIMVNYFCGNVSAAIYSLAYSIGLLPNMLTLAINNALAPWVYKTIKNNDYHKIRNVTKSIAVLLVLGIILLIMLAPEVVRIFAPKSYADTVLVIPSIAASTYAIYIYTVMANVEIYYEATNIIMIGSVLATLFNAISNVIFVQHYGYIAAGYTTLASFYIILFTHFKQYINIEKKEKKIFFDKFFFIISMLFITLISLLAPLLYKNIILRIVIIIGFFICLLLKMGKVKNIIILGIKDYTMKNN